MRTRRHTSSGSGEPFFGSGPWRGFLRDIGLIAATFIVGYGISVLWLSPGPIFTNDHSLPRVLELPEAQARGKLTQLGLRPRIESQRPSDSFPSGAVIWQDPPSGTVLPPNSVVQLVVSTGPGGVPVPDVIGMNLPQATKILAAAGVRVGQVDSTTGAQERGVIVATRPAAGAGRPRGTAIGIVISRGPASPS
jgi:beta-lactam-binding protein with PASTA domain